MIDDPYKELELKPGATQEEIKRAYRQMAKRYHPDRNPGDASAAQKMQRVNEAYDILSNPDKYAAKQAQQQHRSQSQQSYGGQQSGQYHQQQNRQGYGGWTSDGDFNFEDLFGFGFSGQQASTKPTVEPGDSAEFRKAIEYINSGRAQEAIHALTYIPSTGRTARWYYLSALANHALGNQVQALDQIQKAAQMDPQNRTYNQLLRQFRQAGQTYERNAQGFDMYSMNLQKICMGMCLMNLCCGRYPCLMCC